MNILWIEGNRSATPSFVPDLRKKGYQVEVVPTGRAALKRVQGLDPDLVVINSASLRSSGRRICHALREQRNNLPILVICDKSQKSGSVEASQVLVLPFTSRKLLNRIRILVPEKRGKVLKAGPITFFPEGNRVQLEGGDMQQLTPLLTALLKLFMQHPGKVLARERLFREVWRTNYTNDTRTLDVHIRWLRQKIEMNPRKPRLLKTVRGVGFRLNV
ncbi:MAG: response regulator transcription factor [Anaerolineales bacterium]|jgi:DNA-binding response OmpR family regulator